MALWTDKQAPSAGTATGSNPYTYAYPSSVTAGSLLIAVFGWPAGGITITTLGDSLNGSNAWSLAKLEDGNARTVAIYYFNNTAGGACTISLQLSGTTAVQFVVYEKAGPLASIGATGGGSGTATTTPTSGNITPQLSTSLIVGALRGGTASAGGSGWTLTATTSVAGETIQPGTTTPLAATFTQSSSVYAAAIAEFRTVPPVTPGIGGSLVGPYNFWGGGFN
jgi:hypothetical protein